MRGHDHAAGRSGGRPEHRPGRIVTRWPLAAEPDRRQHVQRRRLRAPVLDGNLDEDVLRGRLGVFHEHVEVAVLIEHARIQQLVLGFVAAPAPVGVDQVAVRVRRLGVLVEVLHVRVGRRRVEVEVVLLHVLAVVSLAVGQAEQPFLEDGVLAVPQRQREAEQLAVIGDPSEPVLAPAIGPRAGLVVAEVVPRVARVAIVLPHRPPLPLREIRSPFPPRGGLGTGFLQATTLGVHLQPSLTQGLSSRGVARLPWATHATRSV